MRTVYGITFTLVLMGLISLIIGVHTMNDIEFEQQKAKAEQTYIISILNFAVFTPMMIAIVYFYVCMRHSLNSFTASTLKAQKN